MGIEFNFDGKTALVTGASSGLGARAAKVLAQAGVSVLAQANQLPQLALKLLQG